MLPIAIERHVELVLVDTGDLFVSGDPLRLKQAFGNLISNAIKYSEDGQSVVVRAFRVNRQVVVSFVDWGMGIPKDELPQIAEPFFRSASTRAAFPGTGLGLAIAKQMIELHGGRLAVESEHGAGSTFTAYLPLRTEAVDPGDEERCRRSQPRGDDEPPLVDEPDRRLTLIRQRASADSRRAFATTISARVHPRLSPRHDADRLPRSPAPRRPGRRLRQVHDRRERRPLPRRGRRGGHRRARRQRAHPPLLRRAANLGSSLLEGERARRPRPLRRLRARTRPI